LKRGGREGELFFVIAVAVALGEDEFVVDHDADADAGRVPVFQDLGHVGVEAIEFLGDVGFLRAGGDGEDYESEGDGKAKNPAGWNRAEFSDGQHRDLSLERCQNQRHALYCLVVIWQ